ncbi:MAG: FG-GAP-like repeat-containing protein [Planctomycetota bacterium]|nr:FG-GAP-like repeat-containing protein [Planctomycetota bacterium]
MESETPTPGLPGWTIFVDLNDNGVPNVGEPTTITDRDGNYSFKNLAPLRTYTIRELPRDGWRQTTPADESGGASGADVNLPPEITVPGAQVMDEDSVLNVTGDLSISDPDAGSAEVQVTLSVTDGTLTLPSTGGLAFSDGNGSDDATMTFTGTIDDINAALNVLFYFPSPNFNGTAVITVDANDLGNTGTGGEKTDVETIDVTVTPINDPPFATDDQYTVDGNAVLNVPALGVLANDGDVDGDSLTVAVDTGPSNGVLNLNADGSFSYDPNVGFSGTDSFTYIAQDGGGLQAGATVTIDVVATLVRVRLETADPLGNPISAIGAGEDFQLRVFVDDLRDSPDDEGVFAAYLDLLYDSSLVSITGPLVFASEYDFGRSGDTASAGIIDEAGAFTSSQSPLGGSERLLFSVPVHAEAAGQAVFQADPADDPPAHDVLLFGVGPAVPASAIEYGSATIVIGVAQTTARDDTFPIGVDSVDNELDVLANDFDAQGGALTIVNVGSPDQGGTVVITNGNRLTYTTASGFAGTEQFTYEIEDGVGATDTATVTIEVATLVRVRLATTDLLGNPIVSLELGQDFQLHGYVEDLRPNAAGVFAAYMDIVYDSTHVEVDGPVTFGPTFNNGQSADTDTPGLIDEIGAFDSSMTAPGAVEVLLFTIPFTTIGFGNTIFSTGPADGVPMRDMLLFGNVDSTGVPKLTGSFWQNAVIPKDVSNDASISPIDNLIILNDLSANGARQLTTESTPPFVDVDGNGFITPRDGLFVFDTLAGFATDASVPPNHISYGGISIVTANTPPTARDDTFAIAVNSADNELDVLANDSDTNGDLLAITSVGSTDRGGTVEIVSGGHLKYTPAADFIGVEQFTYQIEDELGDGDTATVTIHVYPVLTPHVVAVGPGQIVRDVDFGNRALLGEIHGQKFNDLNGDGVKDDGEPGLAGWTIYLDLDSDGIKDVGEPTTTTDENGDYSFSGLEPLTTYAVAELQQSGWERTLPARSIHLNSSPLADVDDDVRRVVRVDVNGDGNQDLVILIGGPGAPSGGQLEVLFSLGNGTFTPGPSVGVGELAVSLAAGDIDGDGDEDVLVGHSGSAFPPSASKITIHRNRGDGSFDAPVTLLETTYTGFILVADFDRDQDLDVAGFSGNELVMMRNNGQSVLTQSSNVVAVGVTADFVAAGDLDGVNGLDMAVAGNDKVVILRNNGAGVFSKAGNLTAGSYPNWLALADLDNDNDLDLAVADPESSMVSLLLNNGNFAFSTPVNLAVAGTPTTVVAVDLEQDGDLDLAVTTDELVVLVNDGTGSFGSSVSFSHEPTLFTFPGDFNRDGRTDLLTLGGDANNGGNGQVSLLINQSLPVYRVALDAGAVVANIDFGNHDVGGSGGSGSKGSIAGRLFNDRNGNRRRDAGETFVAGWTVYLDSNTNGQLDDGEARTVTAADDPNTANEDESGLYAFEDLVRATYSVSVVPQDQWKITSPNAITLSTSEFETGDGAQSVAAGDFDGDGDQDLAVANGVTNNISILLNNGSGDFTQVVNVPVGFGPSSVAVGDLDGDGDLELVVANLFSGNVTILTNNGAASFSAGASLATALGPVSVTLADLDGQNGLDMAVVAEFANKVSVLLNNGGGSFAAAVNYSVGLAPQSVSAGDLDGDGDLDLAVANFDTGDVSILKNNASGGFSVPTNLRVGDGPFSVTMVDLDGDNDLDLAVANVLSDDVSILRNNGNGTFSAAANFAAGSGPSFVTSADLDLDGDPDLIITNRSSTNLAILLNDRGVGFIAASNLGVGDFPARLAKAVTAVNLDGDSDADLTIANGDGDSISVLLNTLTPGPNVIVLRDGENRNNVDFGAQPPNEPPTLDSLTDITIVEDAGEQTVSLTGITAGGGETQDLRVTASSGNTSLIPNPSVTYTSASAMGSLKFTPANNQSGTAVVTVTVEDAGPDGDINETDDNGSVQQTFAVNVTPVNDEPVVGDSVAETDEDTPITIALDVTDVEGLSSASVGLRDVNAPPLGAISFEVTADSVVLHYDPSQVADLQSIGSGDSVVEVIVFQVDDGQGGTATGTVTITVRGKNDWHRESMPLDVNGTATVEPLDALIIVNWLNREGPGKLPGLMTAPVFWLDVNNDGSVSPVDVLQVVNHLNRFFASGEGTAARFFGDARNETNSQIATSSSQLPSPVRTGSREHDAAIAFPNIAVDPSPRAFDRPPRQVEALEDLIEVLARDVYSAWQAETDAKLVR